MAAIMWESLPVCGQGLRLPGGWTLKLEGDDGQDDEETDKGSRGDDQGSTQRERVEHDSGNECKADGMVENDEDDISMAIEPVDIGPDFRMYRVW